MLDDYGKTRTLSLTATFMSPKTEAALLEAYKLLMDNLDATGCIPMHHLARTPERVVKAMKELFSGLGIIPENILSVAFNEEHYDQMIIVRNIEFVSVCAHHLLPFQGVAHFGYLPNKSVVGLSKIPRLVDAYARRPQIQECLSRQVVDTFQRQVNPLGCGIVIDAHHSCVSLRGVQKHGARMQTIALAGVFKEADVKAEFLTMVKGNQS